MAIYASAVPQVLWGDEESGYVSDRIYASSDQIHFLTFALPPGGYFRSSDDYWPVYDTHECHYVLRGTYTIHDPKGGEVRVAEKGDAVFFSEFQWHYGYNFADTELVVLEAIAPPPRKSELSLHETQNRPAEVVRADSSLLGKWPREREVGAANITVVDERSSLRVILGETDYVLAHLFSSSERLSMGVFELAAGRRGSLQAHAHDSVLYVEAGCLHVWVPTLEMWAELNEEDGFFLPAGCQHQFFNHADRRARAVFAVAGVLEP